MGPEVSQYLGEVRSKEAEVLMPPGCQISRLLHEISQMAQI